MSEDCSARRIYQYCGHPFSTEISGPDFSARSYYLSSRLRACDWQPTAKLLSVVISVLLLGFSGFLHAQNYNPNNYASANIVQEIKHPHSDLVLVAAHRGLHSTYGLSGLYPENSLESIGAAAQAGIEIIEVDIKLTSDGVPILSHDVTWGRETLCPGCSGSSDAFNPFTGSSPDQQSKNPAVNSLTVAQAKQYTLWTVVNQSDPRASIPTLQDVLDYLRTNKIAAVLAIDIKDNPTAQSCWNVIKANADFNGNAYSQSVLFKMPALAYETPQAFEQAFGNDYQSVLFWPFYGTASISPSTFAIDDSYGTDANSTAGFGSENNIISSLQSFQASKVQIVGTEVNLKQPGGILTNLLTAAKVSNSVAASVGSFNPTPEYINPLDTNRVPQFFNAAGPNAGYCCYVLSDLFYNGAPSGQPSDTADDRGDLNFLLGNGDNVLTTDLVQSVASTLAGQGKRNISYLQAGSGTGQRSIVPLRVMPIGDSITEGYQSSTGNGYRYPLQQDIQNMGQTITFVGDRTDGTMTNPQNEGFSGQQIAYIAGQAVPSAASWRPNVALVLAGTNDINLQNDMPDAPGRLDSMITGLFTSAPDATIIVAGIPPSYDSTFNANLRVFNTSVQSLVATRQNSGQHIEYVSMSNLDPNADKADSLHPNDAGYQIVGNNFAGAVEDVMNRGWVTPAVAINRSTGGGTGQSGPLGSAPGPGSWVPQGQIASGGLTAKGDRVIFADMDGDHKADYVVVSAATGALTVYLNGGANAAAANGWLWYPQGMIAGGTAPGATIQLADLNGDGKADYISVDPVTGAVSAYLNGGPNSAAANGWVWYPVGLIAGGVAPGATVQFGDLNGDGLTDYLIVNPTTGAVQAYLNGGQNPSAANGWVWYPQPPIASGVGAPRGSQVQFADINHDGYADYLTVSSTDGTVSAYLNHGLLPDNSGWWWIGLGQIAPGVGAPSLDLQVAEADIDGDGRADYLAVNRNTGAVTAWLNNGNDTSAVSGWLPRGSVLSVPPGDDYFSWMADIDGDGRADYLEINSTSGKTVAYLNQGSGEGPGGKWGWGAATAIAGGLGAGSTYADFNGDGRADYVQVDPTTGAVQAYLNGGQAADSSWIWYPQGIIYQGYKTSTTLSDRNIQFADINGDKAADYLQVYFTGSVDAALNTGQWSWGNLSSTVYLDFSNDNPMPTEQFADIDGDGLADLLIVEPDGSIQAWLNGGPNGTGWNWNFQGQIAVGTGLTGLSVQFVDVDGDGRADYIGYDSGGNVTVQLNNGGDTHIPANLRPKTSSVTSTPTSSSSATAVSLN